MAKKPRTWYIPAARKPKPKVADAVKAEVEAKANELVEKVLKPQHVKPSPNKPRFNYIIDLSTKWYRNYFYFIATYASPGSTAVSPTFDSPFARLEFTGANRFALSYMRHTGKWFELSPSLSLDECLEAVRDDWHFLA